MLTRLLPVLGCAQPQYALDQRDVDAIAALGAASVAHAVVAAFGPRAELVRELLRQATASARGARILPVLLEAGVAPGSAAPDGLTPLHRAACVAALGAPLLAADPLWAAFVGSRAGQGGRTYY